MPKCKECNRSYGIFELKDGICNNCKDAKTPECKSCRQRFKPEELKDKLCPTCFVKEQNRLHSIRQEEERIQKNIELKKLTAEEIKKIVLTTETHSVFDIEERIDIITAECVLGMNIFKDFMAGLSDVFGGRSEATQNTLKEAKNVVLTELRREAYAVGANAVVGVDLDYSEFSGGSKSMLFIVATGTAVKAKGIK